MKLLRRNTRLSPYRRLALVAVLLATVALQAATDPATRPAALLLAWPVVCLAILWADDLAAALVRWRRARAPRRDVL